MSPYNNKTRQLSLFQTWFWFVLRYGATVNHIYVAWVWCGLCYKRYSACWHVMISTSLSVCRSLHSDTTCHWWELSHVKHQSWTWCLHGNYVNVIFIARCSMCNSHLPKLGKINKHASVWSSVSVLSPTVTAPEPHIPHSIIYRTDFSTLCFRCSCKMFCS